MAIGTQGCATGDKAERKTEAVTLTDGDSEDGERWMGDARAMLGGRGRTRRWFGRVGRGRRS